jgi:flagellar biosynthetic protein FliR
MAALEPLAFGFVLVLLRAGALCATAPLFGTRAVPGRVRLAVAIALALAAFTGAGMPTFDAWESTGALVAATLTQAVLGLAAGLAARLMLDAAGAAGHAIGLGMGLGFGAVIDPVHGAESTAISELLLMLATAAAIAAGVHREAVAWLCRSVMESPPNAPVDLAHVAAGVIAACADAAALSVRLAFPVLAAVTIGHFALGVLGRSAPQMGLSNIGFTVAIVAGGGALYLVAPTLVQAAARASIAVLVGS